MTHGYPKYKRMNDTNHLKMFFKSLVIYSFLVDHLKSTTDEDVDKVKKISAQKSAFCLESNLLIF